MMFDMVKLQHVCSLQTLEVNSTVHGERERKLTSFGSINDLFAHLITTDQTTSQSQHTIKDGL